MAIFVSAIVIAGAAVSYASFKERAVKETKPVDAVVAIETTEAATPAPVISNGNESDVRPADQNLSYEEQGQLMRDKLARKNEAMIQSDNR